MATLEVTRLRKSYGGVRALDGVTFRVEAGEVVAMIGPNGAGKSTCFNLVNGQLPADEGEIALEGRSIRGRHPHDIWRLGVGRTFQVAAVFGSMTARENAQIGLISLAGDAFRFRGKAEEFRRDEANRLLADAGMLEQSDTPCAALAYGDLKRVELALALANHPRLLLMDEPTAGMAQAERDAMMRRVAQIARAERIAVLFTEHDMDVVFGFADRVLVLHQGVLIAEGAPEAVRTDARVQEVYLGAA
jgi:branched-chain amino acid transport system ATP-binding protein